MAYLVHSLIYSGTSSSRNGGVLCKVPHCQLLARKHAGPTIAAPVMPSHTFIKKYNCDVPVLCGLRCALWCQLWECRMPDL